MPETALPRLLIVDDEAAQMEALHETLSTRGYCPLGFTSARAALHALRKEPHDLLLVDLMMPEMDGIALLRAGLEIDPDLVGIVMTGEGTIATAVEAMKAGALDYILKPFKLSAVLPVLARAAAVRRLRREKAALEHRLRERNAELLEANRELDAFAHSVSHDLRSPLNAIIGYSDLLVRYAEPPLQGKWREFAQGVGSEGRHMNALIDDLLRLSRISRHELQRCAVDLSALAEGIIAKLRSAAPERRATIEIEPGLVTDGDEALLAIALDNLLGNAWKYSGRCAEAQIVFRAEAGTYEVRDNGAGFDMSQAEHLFEPFQRLHSVQEFAGTGIGLSIVRRIVQRHGGRIRAESAPDQGASFRFTLAPAPAPALAASQPSN